MMNVERQEEEAMNHDNDESSDDEDMMNMEMPLFVPPPPPKPEKPSTTFEWNSHAIGECLQLSLDSHHSSNATHTAVVAGVVPVIVPEWKAPAPQQSSWSPQPVPMPQWAKPITATATS